MMHYDGGLTHPQAPSQDHKIPRSRKGADTRDNIIICCRRCNEEKASLTPEEFMAVRAGLASRLDKTINERRSRQINPQLEHQRQRPSTFDMVQNGVYRDGDA